MIYYDMLVSNAVVVTQKSPRQRLTMRMVNASALTALKIKTLKGTTDEHHRQHTDWNWHVRTAVRHING